MNKTRSAHAPGLYTRHELAFRTQFAELCERSRNEGSLLPGTPGNLTLRTGTGHGYWYRRYYAAAGQQIEDLVCRDGDEQSLDATRARVEFAAWAEQQVRALRQLGFQVADKDVDRVLVELSNKGLFDAGLVLVGSLAYMIWLNELGLKAVASRTQDVDLARRQRLELGAPLSFLETVQGTRLKFFPVPALTPGGPSTSVKLSGKASLRVDLLAPGRGPGQVVALPELQWHAQTVPHFDYLLHEPRRACALAGGHCIPVAIPAPERLVWHKLYSSANRRQDLAKAEKDLLQAATLLAALVEDDHLRWADTAAEVPAAVFKAARGRLGPLRRLLAPHPQALDEVEHTLATAS
jgi:hypothetical protein